MNSRGYIGTGVGSAIAGVCVIALAQSSSKSEEFAAHLAVAAGETPEVPSHTGAYLLAIVLFLVAIGLVLVGLIGTGIKVGRREAADEVRSESSTDARR